MSDIVYLTEETFPSTIATGTNLVVFSAEWCGPCKMLLPILEKLATEVHGKSIVAKIDVDEAQNIANNYDITSVPTIIVFVDGEEKYRTVGVKDLNSLKKLLS